MSESDEPSTPQEDRRYLNAVAANPPPESSWGKLLGQVPQGARVLEVGCAYGSFSLALKRLRGCTVVGVEVDPRCADTARARVDVLHVGDIARLLEDQTLPADFDVVVAADVLEHLADPQAVLRGLATLLKPGGAMLCSIPNVAHLSVVLGLLEGRFQRSREGLLDATHIHFFGERDVLDLFRGAGCAVRVVDRVQLDPRNTEFKSDLSAVPSEVLDFLDKGAGGFTYQFIVRAVPKAWATAEDDRADPAAPRQRTITHDLVAELKQAQAMVGDYHKALQAREAEASDLHQRMAEYHTTLTGRNADYDAAQNELGVFKLRVAELEATLARKERALRELQLLDPAAQGAASPDLAGLRVLYVTNREDAPYRYRCVHAVEQLRAAGVVANIAHLDAPDLLEEVSRYSVVVLFRLEWSARVDALTSAAKASGAHVAFEIDDLIFHPDAEHLIPFLKRMPPSLLGEYRRQFGALQRTLLASDFCIASTPIIARAAEAQGKPGVVHPNLLSSTYLQLSKAIFPFRPVLQRKPLIGYMSGSRTHDGDIEQISEALARVLTERPDVQLLFCGPLALPERLVEFEERIIRFPYQDYRVYPWLMARCRLLLAPLETTNDFANAKSPLKVFEAGLFGVPVVATSTDTYREAIDPGVTGFLASSTSEWVEGIRALLGFRASLRFGRRARELALRRYSPEAFPQALANKLARRAGSFRGSAPELRPFEPQASGAAGFKALARETVLVARSSLVAAVQDPQLSARDAEGQVAALVYTEPLKVGNEVSQALVAFGRRGNALLRDRKAVGTVLADLEHPLEPASDLAVEVEAGVPGAFRSTGTDPFFMLPSVPAGARSVLVVELQVEPMAEAPFAQLFWRPADQAQFCEGNSLVFPVLADGAPHTYVVDLREQLGYRWPLTGEVALRFDPLPCPGRFRVFRLALLAERPTGPVDLRRALGERYVAGDGLEVGARQNPMPLPASARVRYVDRLSPEQLRAHDPELDGMSLVSPSVLAEADKLDPVETGSQDFVVTNQVLKHLRDPLGGLREWIRVLKPGGTLYCAVPDRSNTYDKRREVTTFDHLLADRGPRAARETADQAHYEEWTRSVHPAMSPAEQAAFTEKISRERYDIHFHVFDGSLFEKVVRFAAEENLAEVVEFLSVEDEHFAVLRKKEPGLLAARVPRGVDIVVPVYNARDFTRACVESVLKHATGDWRLVLVNDKSTDEGVTQDLREFARRSDRVVLLENEQNLGFVMTANRGMREAAGRDVLLLNSDTEVYAGFLDRLRACAYAEAVTGILSPFSNNATICSIPDFGKDNPIPEGYTPERWAELVSACSRHRRPELVTAVGFCMFIRAEVLEKVGFFDEVSYGRGFGEENDLCERAKKAGFKIRLCDDVFVYHKGKASFGDEGRALEGTNGKVLESKHPGYHAAVARYFEANPLAPAHEDIRLHLPRLRRGYEQAVLFVLHASPFDPVAGGTEFHVRDMVRALRLPRAVIGYPDGASLVAAEVVDGAVEAPTYYRFPLSRRPEMFCIDNPEVTGVFRRWVGLFGIRAAHIHHLLHLPIRLGRTLGEAGVDYCYTAHDFYAVCPSWNLFDFDRRKSCACASGGAGCVDAVRRTTGVPFTVPAEELRAQHREAFQEFFARAKALVYPSVAARDRAHGYLQFDLAKTYVLPHGSDARLAATWPPRGERLRVGIVGEVAFPIKGANNYLALLKSTADLGVDWHFFGGTTSFGFERQVNAIAGLSVTFHGRYQRETIVDLLAKTGIDVVVLLPEVDETFSFVLSEAITAGVPVIANRKGALVERIEAGKFGLLVDGVAGAKAALEGLVKDREALERLAQKAREFHHPTVADRAAELRAIYEGLGFLASSAESGPFNPAALQELSSRRTVAAPPPPPEAPTAPKYQGSWWYPYFLRVKPLIPEVVRQRGRRQLTRNEGVVEVLHPLKRRNGMASALHDIEILRRGTRTLACEAKSRDPHIVFTAGPFNSREVRAVRFRMRHDSEGKASAQIFWTHDADEAFSEAKSVRVELQKGALAEYELRMDTPELQAAWQGGAEIFRLRFDPVDQLGTFEMGPVELMF